METGKSKGCWIDSDELARAGAELAGGEPSGVVVDEPLDLFGDAPLASDDEESPVEGGGRASPSDIGRIGEQLAEIRARAERSGLLRLAGVSPVAEGGVGQPPGSGESLVERLESFVAWAAGQRGLMGLFISDFGANELVESGADPALVASGVALADGWERARGELEDTHRNGVSTAASVRDSEGGVLTVFSCRSAYGQHVLGVLSPAPLPALLSAGLRAGFARVMGVGL